MLDRVEAGADVAAVTPTASGKTLCYNAPVLNRILREPDARALYLFPTKALSQDQKKEILDLVGELKDLRGEDVRADVYDGDTPGDARRSIRTRAHIVVTNPDMLHAGILPHHTKWAKLFENLRFVVIDEMHTYRGVFGSHLANLLRRLRRVCAHYGAAPQFILSSATIANPRELAEGLTERPISLVDRSGAPRPERFFLFYNPPVVNPELGIRRSAMGETRRIAGGFLKGNLQTIVFARSRTQTEVLVKYLKQDIETRPDRSDRIRGYRGGYLPKKRREIEDGIKNGSVLGVVSTNALELGIDIGSLDVAVISGYPGTIASTWQQAGRAGRRGGTAAAVLVANSTPINQFVIQHPDYFFEGTPERGLINPENLQVLIEHLKCAAFELPFRKGETFGDENLEELLGVLEEEKILYRAGDRWFWTADSYPANSVSLRSISSDNFVVHDRESGRVIAEVDFVSAHSTLHEKAIYMLESDTYYVEQLDHQERRAAVRPIESDYYTDAVTHTKVTILDAFEAVPEPSAPAAHGEVHVVKQVVGFKKDQVLHGRERRLRRTRHAGRRDAHHRVLARGAAGGADGGSLRSRGPPRRHPRDQERDARGGDHLSHVRGPRHRVRDRDGFGGRRAASGGTGGSRARRGGRGNPDLHLRQLSGGYRFLGAALGVPRHPARRDARPDRTLSVPGGMPVVRRPVGEIGRHGKAAALAILEGIRGREEAAPVTCAASVP